MTDILVSLNCFTSGVFLPDFMDLPDACDSGLKILQNEIFVDEMETLFEVKILWIELGEFAINIAPCYNSKDNDVQQVLL